MIDLEPIKARLVAFANPQLQALTAVVDLYENAPTDIFALVAEVEEQLALIADLNAHLKGAIAGIDMAASAINRVNSENERLQAELADTKAKVFHDAWGTITTRVISREEALDLYPRHSQIEILQGENADLANRLEYYRANCNRNPPCGDR